MARSRRPGATPAGGAGRFTRWAVANLAGEELEFALVLQRGYFVALSRVYDMETVPMGPASQDPMPSGVCFSYSPGQAEHAYRVRAAAATSATRRSRCSAGTNRRSGQRPDLRLTRFC